MQTFRLAPGSSLVGAMPADGGLIYGLSIDNPSNAWLSIYPLGLMLAPLTAGWSHSFPAGVPAVDVRFAPVGPASAVSLAAGDTIVISLLGHGEAVPDSLGTPVTPVPVGPALTGVPTYTAVLSGVTVAAANPLMALAAGDARLIQLRRVRIQQSALGAAAAAITIDLVRVTLAAGLIGITPVARLGPAGLSISSLNLYLTPAAANLAEIETIRRYRMPVRAAVPQDPAIEERFTGPEYPPEAQGAAITSGNAQGYALIARGAMGTASADLMLDFTTIGLATIPPTSPIR